MNIYIYVIQHDAKIKVLITIIIASLFAISRLVRCLIFSYDFPKIRNLPMIFLRNFENVAPGFLSGEGVQ